MRHHLLRVLKLWIHLHVEVDSCLYRSAILRLCLPDVDTKLVGELCDNDQALEIESPVVIWMSSHGFKRLFSTSCDLFLERGGEEGVYRSFCAVVVANQDLQRYQLVRMEGSVIAVI